jgi:hypothetical protein
LRLVLNKFRIGVVTAEVQWSELQRDPKAVAALADRGAVRVRRRDGVPLLLMPQDRAVSAGEGAVVAARALRGAMAHLGAGAGAEVLSAEFAWVDVLPVEDRAAFLREFVRSVEISAELGEWSYLAGTIREWRATAQAHADPLLLAALSREVEGDLGPVGVPEPV